MSDVLPADSIDLPEVPYKAEEPVQNPVGSIDALLRDHYGLSGQVLSLETGQEAQEVTDFLIDNGHMRYLLKVEPADTPAEDIEAEQALMRHILRSPDGPRVPEPITTKDGAATLLLPIDGAEKRIHLVTFLDGEPAPKDEKLPEAAIAAFGTLSASLAMSLAEFAHPILDREPEDDMRRAGPLTVSLLSAVPDHEIRDTIAKAMVAALRRIQPLAPDLRVAPAHQNFDCDAVIGESSNGNWQPNAVTDFTGISMGWLAAGLANTCAYLLGNQRGDAFSLLPAIRAYHRVLPLTAVEQEALWPLIVARTGILAAEAENARLAAPDDAVAAEKAERHRSLLEMAASVSPAMMFCAILDATSQEMPLPEIGRLLPDMDPETIRIVDLGVASPLLFGGNWTDPENDWKMLAHIAWETGCGATRWGEYRLSKSLLDPSQAPENFALHIDACVPAGSNAVAPFAGTLKAGGQKLILAGRDLTLHVEGLDCDLPEGTEMEAGAPIGVIAGAKGTVGGLRLRLCRDPEMLPPLFCTQEKMGLWSKLCPSPAAMLGIEADAPAIDRTGEPIRGWKEYLFDGTGRALLDFSGAAPLIGHGHPQLANAIYRQSALLDSRPHNLGPTETQHALRARLENGALGNLFPLSVVTSPETAAATLEPDASPLAVASALASLDVIDDEELIENAREIGTYLKERLEQLQERFPAIIAISGEGLMLDIELSETAANLAERLKPDIFTAGTEPDRLVLRPPLCLSRQSVDVLIDRLQALLSET